MKLIKLEFNRDENGEVIYDDENLDTIRKFVLPIIVENIGWGTGDLTVDDFENNKEKWRGELNAILGDLHNTYVYVAINEEDQPLGLLEFYKCYYNEEYLKDAKIIYELLNSTNNEHWQHIYQLGITNEDFVKNNIAKVKEILLDRPVIKYIGVVVKPELQGAKSGVSDLLYNKMDKNAFVFGWTSSPLVLSKRRKFYTQTMFFPLHEPIETVEGLTALVIGSDSIFNDNHKQAIGKCKFGVDSYKYFVLRDKEETMKQANALLSRGKILQSDFDNINYMLDFPKGQGVIVSWN